MIAYTRRQLIRLLKLDFIRFCIVGGTGFVINLILLSLLHKLLGINIFLAQLIGAEVALFSNFMLHHHWTYKAHKVEKSMKSLVVQFHASSWPAILGSSLIVSFGVKVMHLGSTEALIMSSIVALAWNFIWSKYVIWRDVSKAEVERIAR